MQRLQNALEDNKNGDLSLHFYIQEILTFVTVVKLNYILAID